VGFEPGPTSRVSMNAFHGPVGLADRQRCAQPPPT
jgi:hypothetical protein